MKVLLTGSTGWVGGYVLEELLKREDLQIIANLSVGSLPKKLESRVTYTTQKITDLDDIPDAVIYLAWPSLDYYDSLNHSLFVSKAFEELRTLSKQGVRNITVTGTCFEYGKAEGELFEDQNQKDQNNLYAIAKDSLRKMLSTLDIDLKWLRLFYLYGEGQKKSSLIPRLEQAVKDGKKEFLVSGLSKIRDYLHVKQAALYIVELALQTKETGIINVCSGRPTQIKEILQSYIDWNNLDIEIREDSVYYSDYGAHSFYGNINKLRRALR